MTTYVINGEESQLPVQVDFPLEGGKREFIFIQPKSKAKIPPGSVVNMGFLLSNPKVKILKVDDMNEPNSVFSAPIPTEQPE